MSAAPARHTRLVDWMRSASGVKVNPAVDVDPSTGALCLQSAVGKGAQLLDLPATAVLSSGGASDMLGNGAAALEAPAALAAMLLAERARGANSPHAALIAALPTALDQPFLWTDSELARLAGSDVRAKALAVRAGIEDEWAELVAGVGLTATLDEYLWAQAIVTSRAFELGSAFPLVLAPGADLAMHALPGQEPTAAAIVSGGAFFSKPRFLLCSTAELAAGAQLSLAYMDDSSAGASDFLLDYGFVPEGVTYTVDVSFAMAPLDPFYEDKLDILELNEEVTAPTFVLSSATSRGLWTPPEFLEAFMRLLCLGATDAFLLEAVFRKDVYGFMELPISRPNEEAMCEAIIAACEDLLDGYALDSASPPSPVDTEENNRSSVRAALAAAVVEGEVAVLETTIAHYRKQLQSLDALEYYQERRLKALDLLRPLDDSEIVDADGGGRMGQAFDENY